MEKSIDRACKQNWNMCPKDSLVILQSASLKVKRNQSADFRAVESLFYYKLKKLQIWSFKIFQLVQWYFKFSI